MRKTLTATIFALLLLGMSASAYADVATDASELMMHRKFDEAITFINNAIAKDPTYAELYYWLGRVYVEKEDWAQAEAQFNKALELKKKTRRGKSLPGAGLHRKRTLGGSQEDSGRGRCQEQDGQGSVPESSRTLPCRQEGIFRG